MKPSHCENHLWYSFIRENAKKYATHIPHGFGKSIVLSSNHISYDCTKSFRKGYCTEYESATIAYRDPPLLVQPTDIYHEHVGMIPNYLGHIPGAVFRCGKTFGTDTKDAKKWLQTALCDPTSLILFK